MKNTLNELICYFMGHVYERTFNAKTDHIIKTATVVRNAYTGQKTHMYQSCSEYQCSRCGEKKMITGGPTF